MMMTTKIVPRQFEKKTSNKLILMRLELRYEPLVNYAF